MGLIRRREIAIAEEEIDVSALLLTVLTTNARLLL